MSSIAKSKKRSKKTKRLGAPSGLRSDHYEAFDVDSKVECIRALIPLGLMHVQEVLETEVCTLAGARYARKTPDLPGRRHGSNPGSVQLAGQRHPLRIPRVQRKSGGEIPLDTLEQLCGTGRVDDLLLKRVLYGISCRNYETAAAAVPGAIGLSSSTVSRTFTRASAQQLQAPQDHDVSQVDVVAVFLDGKSFADMTMVMAVGIALTGEKHLLGFVETGTENETVLTPFLHSLCDRGLEISQGLLVIIDGGKGLRAAGRRLGLLLSFNCANGTSGRMWSVIFPKENRSRGAHAYSGPISVPPMWKRRQPCAGCSGIWKPATNRRPRVWPKAWRKR